MDLEEIEGVIEGLLFTAGDILPLDRIAEIMSIDKKTVKNIMESMIVKSANSKQGIIIREINNGYQLCTRPEYFEFIQKLAETRSKQRLSQAAYEVLAIIAYRQPVTKAKIDQIRGVNSDSAVIRLIEKNLIKEAGRLDVPGRPILYETTVEFLRAFGFRSKGELPPLSMDDINGISDTTEGNIE